MGRISGLYGVKGWVKVFSHTQPREGITRYPEWQVKRGKEWLAMKVESGRRHGKTVVVKLAGIGDRDAAAALHDAEVAVWRSELPPAKEGEIYWTDLEGLAVRTIDGVDLGRISHLVETGSNDVMVVKGERQRLVPFIREQVVTRIDLDEGIVEVDWDPEF
ncbi:MAG: ribosome maturation factor RimM [Gammaproteobacteria bacterium]|nr:ribosome maturation factor RimM [Gammaproteobacteria bacterium]